MSRELADAVALANDAANQTLPRWRSGFIPRRVDGLAARLLAASNALYNRIDYRDGGSFAEPGTTRHAGWPWA